MRSKFYFMKQVLLHSLFLMIVSIPAFASPLNGTYTIAGASPNYTNLYAAVQDLIANGVSGPCVFNIRAGSYTAGTNDWQVAIPSIAGVSATNTITFQAESGPGTVTITATGSSGTNYVERFNSATYTTFQNLSFVNNSSSYGHVIEFAGSANNNTVNGCVLTSSTSTSTTQTNSNNAVVFAYNMSSGAAYNKITGNTINNGNIGVHIYTSSSTSLLDNFVVDNNTFSNAYVAGVYAYNTSNLKVRGNTIAKSSGSNTFYAIYTQYNRVGGLEINSNTITAGAGHSGTMYGVNAQYYYNDFQVRNNVIATSGSYTGSLQAIYLYNTSGTRTQADKRGAVTGNTITTNQTSGTAYGIYTYYSNYDSISNNTVTLRTTSGQQIPYYNYSYNYPWNDANGGKNICLTNNTFDCQATSSGSIMGSGYWSYATKNMVIANNNIRMVSGTGSISYYIYYADSLTFANNTIFDSTSSSITAYHGYYGDYATSLGTQGNFSNNNIRLVSTSSSVSHYFGYYIQYNNADNNNVYVYANSSITNYLTYYNWYGTIKNNTVSLWSNISSVTSGLGYYNMYGVTDNNNLTVRAGAGSLSMYNAYMGGTYTNNTINATGAGSSTMYNYNGYNTMSGAGNVVIDHNVYNMTQTGTGYIQYGSYAYSYNYSNLIMTNNIFNWTVTSPSSNSNGLYWYYPSGTIRNNVFSMNVLGGSGGGNAAYLLYGLGGNYTDFINNTFNFNGSSSNNVATIWDYLYSAGTTTFRNNIISRTGGTTGCAFLSYDLTGNYTKGDYNIYYGGASPTGIQQGTSLGGGSNVASMQAWRTATGQDKNSLTYDPGFMNPSTGDLRPDPANSNSWSVQGRGVQIPGNNTDVLGNARAVTTAAGVPDLGAYEFTPTATAPLCVATPAAAVAGSDQVFTFGQDTVAVISWASTSAVPASGQIFCKQYTGIQPPAGFTAFNPTAMYFYDSIDVSAAGSYNYSIKNYFKDPWLGTIATKSVLHLAKKDVANAGPWTAYPYTVSTTDPVRNFINTVPTPSGFSNFGLFTGMDIANNAGVSTTVAAPTGTFCPGTYTVKINVLNNGNNVINNVQVFWQANGLPAVPNQINWTTPIGINNGTPGSNVATVTLGNITFGSGTVLIKAWTSLPNGVVDPVSSDDTVSIPLHAAFAGIYTIGGTTPDFPDVVTALSALNTYGLCGATTFNIRPGTYVGNLKLGNIPGISAVNRVTFQSENGIASSTNIVYSATTYSVPDNYVVWFNNASYFTFKNLTIEATGTNYGYVLYVNGNSSNDSVIGCNLNTRTITSSYMAPLYASGLTGNNPNWVFQNNNMNGGYWVYWFGNSGGYTKDMVFENNVIASSGYYPFYNYYSHGLKFNGNTLTTTYSSAYYGAMLMYAQKSPQIMNNKVLNIPNGYGMYIYQPAGNSSTDKGLVKNNVVSVGSGGYYGLEVYYSSNMDYYNNIATLANGSNYAGFFYIYGYQNNNIKNNVFYNTAGGYAAYIYDYLPATNNNQIDYNLYYSTSASNLIYDAYNGTNRNLAGWRAAKGWDLNSVNYQPGLYNTTNNPMPDPSNPNSWAMNGRGVHIAGNTTDINGNPRVTLRANGTPDIGAVEFEPTVAPPNCSAVPATATPGAWQHYLFGIDTVASVYWRPDLLYTSPLNVKQYSGRIGTAASPITSISPNRFMYFYTDIAATNPGTTYHFDANVYYEDIWLGRIQNEAGLMMAEKTALYPWQIYANGSSGVTVARKMISVSDVTSFGAFTGIDTVATFSAFVHLGGTPIFCTGDSVTLFANTGNSYTYRWFKDGNLIPGATASSYTVKAGGDYYVEVTAPGPPTYVANSVPVSISVVPPPMALISANGALTYCTGTSLSLSTSPGAFSYQWQLNGVNVGGNSNVYTVGAAGSYKVTVRNIGCSVTSPAMVVSPGPLSVSLGADVRGCEIRNVPYTIDAGHPGAKYTWYLNGNNTGDTTQTINVFKGTGDYAVIVDAGPGCIATDTVHMQIDPLPTVTGISFIKSGNQYQFSASGAQNATSYLWIFDDNGTITTSTQQTPPAKTFSASMRTKLVVCNSCGCDTTTVTDWATGISNTNNDGYEVSLYPNPAKDKVTLSAKGNITFTDITVLNSIGEVVYKEAAVNAKAKDIDVSMFANGHYMIRANTTEGTITKPFNIVR